MLSLSSMRPTKFPVTTRSNDVVSVEFVIKYTEGSLPLIPRQTDRDKDKKALPLRDLYVYAYVTSEFMAYPDGPRDKSHERITQMNKQHQCKICLDVLRMIPENAFLHLCLITPDFDTGQYHTTATTLARCQIDLKEILDRKGGMVSTKCLDAYRFNDDVGTLAVSLSSDTATDAKVSKRYQYPTLRGRIDRPTTSKWEADMVQYINSNYAAVWKTYKSDVWFPGPERILYTPTPIYESLWTIEGIFPVLLYYAGACQMTIPHPDAFVESMIRIGCLCAGVLPASLETMSDKQRLPVMCYAITALPRLLGYSYDWRSSAHNQPLEADNIGLSSMVCVEVAVLCHAVVVAMRTAKSPRSRLFHRLLNTVFDVAILSCTNHSVDINGVHLDTGRHAVACLVPRTMWNDSGADNKNESWRPQLLDAMDNQDFDAVDTAQCPGMTAVDEPSCIVGNLLPAQYTQKRIFVDVPIYQSAIKLYKIDDLTALREYTFITDGKKAGMPMRDFFASATRLDPKKYSLFCPIPLSVQSECVKTARSYWNETRTLSNVYMDERTQTNGLTDQKVQALLTSAKPKGWRFSFCAFGSGLSPEYTFRAAATEKQFRVDFDRQLEAELRLSNDRAQAHHQHNLHDIRSNVVGEYAIVGGVKALLLLTTYEL
jgi:hypothetical protein